jgi:hypothetical protein
MEIVLYLGNFVLVGWLLFWSVQNTERSTRKPVTGLFRFRDIGTPPIAPSAGQARRPR